jgi:hypothetical protein
MYSVAASLDRLGRTPHRLFEATHRQGRFRASPDSTPPGRAGGVRARSSPATARAGSSGRSREGCWISTWLSDKAVEKTRSAPAEVPLSQGRSRSRQAPAYAGVRSSATSVMSTDSRVPIGWSGLISLRTASAARMCSSVSWKLIATAVPFALVGQEQEPGGRDPLGRLRISADRGDVRLDRLGVRAGEADYSCVHDSLLSLGVPTLLGGRDPCCGVLLHSALLRPERVAASDDQNCERAVLLLDGSSVGDGADRVQARGCYCSEERAREELRTSAYLSDRARRECLVRGSFCARCRGVGGGAFERRCCVRGLCSGQRPRPGVPEPAGRAGRLVLPARCVVRAQPVRAAGIVEADLEET